MLLADFIIGAELTDFGAAVFSILNSRHSSTGRAIGCKPVGAGSNPAAETRGE